MNRSSPNPDQEVAAQAEPAAARLFRTWRQLLCDCAAKPTRKRVHALRVVTMRLQAVVASCLADRASKSPTRAVAKPWKKRSKRLRRRLSVVREIDVHLIKLAHLRDNLTATGKARTQSARASLRQLTEFERKLKKDRRAVARDLAFTLRDRLDRLSRRSLEVEALLSPQSASSPAGASHRLIAELQAALAGAPKLDAGSLHDFRKQIKRLRYVAEPHMESDPRIAQFAKTLKAMQDVIGEWHDWQTLATESARVLADRTSQADLTALLEARVAESLEHALGLCESSIAQLGLQAQPVLPAALERRPVRHAESSPICNQRRSA
jgi:CHAD domain-containing protein